MKQFDLDNDPKITSGFKIPDDYFETFENKIMGLLPEKEVKVISIFQTKKFWYKAVAAIVILCISIPMCFNYITNTSLTPEDYLAYDSSITTEDIAEHLTDDDITAIEESLQLYDAETTNYVKDYL